MLVYFLAPNRFHITTADAAWTGGGVVKKQGGEVLKKKMVLRLTVHICFNLMMIKLVQNVISNEPK
jgi:hypothetical protein